MDYLFQDGGKPKKTKSKTSTKTGTKTTKSKTSTKKGGNFLGTVGDLVAPTGWGSFATAAGLLALDRADSALRRGKSTKSSAKKGGMRGGMDPVNTNTRSNERRLIQLYDYLHSTKDRNSHYFKDLFKQIKELEEEIERKKKLKQQKNQNNQIIRNTIRYNNKKRNYVQDFIAGIFLPGDKYDIEEDVAFRHALRNSKGIRDEAELTRIIEEAKIARKNRKNIFKTTKATLNSIPTNTMWAYKR